MSNEGFVVEQCDSNRKRVRYFCFYGLVIGAGIGIVFGPGV